MDVVRAFSSVFEDQEWVGKLAIVAMLTFAIVLFPFGLIALAVLLGYAMELAINVRDGKPYPLPRWDNMGDKLSNGINILIAFIVYNIFPIGLIACSFTFLRGLASALICCLFPVMIIYGLAAGMALAFGTVRYMDTGQPTAFYQFGDLFASMRDHSNEIIEWLIYSVIANVLIGLVGLIPCIGWLAALALSVPVQAHMLGQLAYLINEKPKRKPKRGNY
jgi:hypothetical protein